MSKEMIINLFYIDHLTVKDISNKVNTSSAYITKVIKQDSRYLEEKLYRKNLSKEKRKIAQNNFIKNKREKMRLKDSYDFVQLQHEQDVRELSKVSKLSDESFRKWNYSAYKYNPLKKRFEFDEKLGRAADVPKYIKRRWFVIEKKIVELIKITKLLEKSQDEYFITIIFNSFKENLLTVEIHSKLDFSMQQKCEISLENESIAKIDALVKSLKIFMGGVANE